MNVAWTEFCVSCTFGPLPPQCSPRGSKRSTFQISYNWSQSWPRWNFMCAFFGVGLIVLLLDPDFAILNDNWPFAKLTDPIHLDHPGAKKKLHHGFKVHSFWSGNSVFLYFWSPSPSVLPGGPYFVITGRKVALRMDTLWSLILPWFICPWRPFWIC